MRVFKLIITLFIAVISMLLVASCKKDAPAGGDASNKFSVEAIDPGSAAGGAVITVKGAEIGQIKSIVFDKGNVPATFNPVFNTNSALVFRVPDTAYGGKQNVTFTNSLGKTSTVSFEVVALPLINSASDYNFVAGRNVTLTGNNLEDVSSVTVDGSTTPLTVVSKTKRQMVVTMPVTTSNTIKLRIKNPYGDVVANQEFVNFNNAYKIFTEGFDNGFQDASWGASMISSTEFKTGTKSFGMKFGSGAWSQMGFGWSDIPKSISDTYKYLTFWIKGGSQDYSLYIWSSASPGGSGTFETYNKIAVPKNVWTYFKIPLSQLRLWSTADKYQQLGWRIQGPDKEETFYLDDVAFVK